MPQGLQPPMRASYDRLADDDPIPDAHGSYMACWSGTNAGQTLGHILSLSVPLIRVMAHRAFP